MKLLEHTSSLFRKRPAAHIFLLLLLPVMTLFLALRTMRAAAETQQEGRPHIIFIMVDALRADHVSAYGYARQTTPVLDSRLAGQGVLFREATAVSSWTNPSNGAMLTSLMPSDIDTVWADINGSIPEEETLLAEILHHAGYVTAGFISSWWMRDRYGYAQGFEAYQATEGDDRTRATAVNELAMAWLNENDVRLSNDGSPLFLFLYYYDPHTLYDPPPPYDTLFDPGYAGSLTPEMYGHGHDVVSGDLVLDERDLEHLLALYDGDIAFWDQQLGVMLDDLQSRGLLQDSLLILSSDHGQMFGEHGKWVHRNSLYEEVLRVPLLFRYTGKLPPGQALDGAVDHLDVVPTILDLAGLDVPAHMRGRSLAPLMMGEQALAPKPVYAEMAGETDPNGDAYWIAPRTRLYAIKEAGYKFIHTRQMPAVDELYAVQAASLYERQNIMTSEQETARMLWNKLKERFDIPIQFLFLPVIEK